MAGLKWSRSQPTTRRIANVRYNVRRNVAPPPRPAAVAKPVANIRPNYYAPTQPVDNTRRPQPGMLPVFFEVPWTRLENGWDILSRRYARAMYAAGIDVRLYPWANAQLVPEVMQQAAQYAVPVHLRECPVYVYSTCFASPGTMRVIIERYLLSKPMTKVFFTMFERLNVSGDTAAILNQLNGVWVPCSANRDRLRAAGCHKAEFIPVPYFGDDPYLTVPPPTENRTFYWIGNWSPRKASENLIRAFMRAFKPGEARLVLKTGPWRFHAHWPEPEDYVRGEMRFPDVAANGWAEGNWQGSIVVDRRRLLERDMVTLHASGDVYVSASRGEGVDMPAFAAKLAGRQIITTDSGGPRDFLTEGDVLVPQTGAIATHPDYGWEPGSTYVDYRLEDLILAFSEMRAAKPAGRRMPPAAFDAIEVGKKLNTWLRSI